MTEQELTKLGIKGLPLGSQRVGTDKLNRVSSIWNLNLFTEDVTNSLPDIKKIKAKYAELNKKLDSASVLAKKTIIQELVCLMVWRYIARFWKKISGTKPTEGILDRTFYQWTRMG